ncbi:hypothetical protein A2631_02375 [Candidatus Daviesbacteria bacterium RIFCSPHIGHO2_01_FULL_44_29]|uniref:Transcobalamin-like C-terminal domain-containing protein n=1 Tax=Candidatus Daviesbacteria bacterium RIFCSPHIGHO2_02_FULL_43_12 TaxID=1797776 RepID=A0A1F5KJX3_9BACT|nr:MAG: hypothetical protein A2631_02375 [Candidatus Daviesbacteria bacterium RIFCSPHIGHO2_01_FULL_44_29]OGE40977.1 MAG: hypothetical protein A3E86_03580 [Candidatus Daviesbacteria bacterium RIFCSPHIGHO2_12_FULL_47_45]OGE41237.1 MAG: hypothetical protein A3D25_01770 [Candidatus Daviesbacteria bacterium RIFCSPHIGHO2_02_FULL_43_12]OGE69438.1 MAG: hypothetical protein A3B55_03510 [Candidatus Daviesbacteria bacterium RIFCSPLOWO2_01_FULL_43_15]
MKKPKIIFIFVLAVVLLVAAVSNLATPTPVKNSPVKNLVEYPCQPGKTAFDLLEESASVDAKDSSFGKMVTGINGVSQDNGKYWLYLVDNKEATIGAQAYNCIGNEQIKWELK